MAKNNVRRKCCGRFPSLMKNDGIIIDGYTVWCVICGKGVIAKEPDDATKAWNK